MLDLDTIFDDSLFPFDWDKKTYKFDREEKDMHPYSSIDNEKARILIHNILGIDKEDLKMSTERVNGIARITISGTTKDMVGKERSINSTISLNDNNLDLTKIKAIAKNGLLYITIPKKIETKETKKEITIE